MEANREAEAMLRGQVNIWKYMFGHVDSAALKFAVELRIPDIIHSHAGPINLSQIASAISDSPPPNITTYLSRIMRFLVHKKIFTAHHQSNGGDTLYGLTHSSRWLIRDSEMSLSPMVLFQNHANLLAPWQCLTQCAREGGNPFHKVHGRQIWDLSTQNHDFNKLLNDGMQCTARMLLDAMISAYKDGFSSVRSLVDVGGGTGKTMAEIVKSYPHIKGINFDLPHVIATAPAYDGVSHVEGDMFEDIPHAAAVFMKWILHDWGDEDCVRILKNCKKAIKETSSGGKVIIMEAVMEAEGDDDVGGMFDEMKMMLDLAMLTFTTGGKERTEEEWKKLLKQGGFPRYKITNIPALLSIIEACPE